MRTLVVFAVIVVANALLLAASTGPAARLSPGLVIMLAIVVNLTAGIRLGYQCAHAYVEDVARINRLVAEQNSELVQANRELLERAARSHPVATLHLREGQRA